MLPGFFIALFSQEVFKFDLPSFVIGLLSLCLVSSSNYVLNELLDAKTDRAHKEKSKRPVATGLVSLNEGLILWGLLAIASFFLSFHLSPSFGLSVAALWIAGCCYNTPPIRLKDIAYADVLSESINSPIRFLAGWFLVLETQLPPLSILIAYWFATAFFLAAKRYAEFGSFASREQATAYRKSFAHYSENMLLIHLVFYITTGAFFGGIFIVRHRPELIVIIPLVASFFAYYLKPVSYTHLTLPTIGCV